MPAFIWARLDRWWDVWITWKESRPKTFWTWRGAARAAGAYDSDVLNRFRVARRPAAVPSLPDDHPLALALLGFPATAAPAVVDLGGGTGDLMLAVLQRWPNARCTVIETPGMVALMAGTGPVTFATEIPAKCDVFYSGGTLQYLPSPYRTLARAFASASVAVVLARNCFSDRTLIRVQAYRLYDNGAGPIPAGFEDRAISYPHRTIRERRVLEMAGRAGFRLVADLPDSSGVLPCLGRVYGKTLVFTRNPQK